MNQDEADAILAAASAACTAATEFGTGAGTVTEATAAYETFRRLVQAQVTSPSK